MTARMVEVEGLATVAEQLVAVQRDAARVAEVLMQIRLSSDEEILARWRPEIQTAIDDLVVTSDVLHRIRTATIAPGWRKPDRSKSLLAALVELGRALVNLVARTEAMQAEIQARNLVVRMRGSALANLPRSDREALMLARNRLLEGTEPADG